MITSQHFLIGDMGDIMISKAYQCPDDMNVRTLNQTWWSKPLLLCSNATEQYNTTLYTTGLCYEHRHTVFSFPTFLGPQLTQSRNNDYTGRS